MDGKMTSRHQKSAFTLIELILAISLLATITVTAYLCLSTATRTWRVGVEAADAVNHGDYIMEQILMGLRSAYYPEVGTVDGSAGQYGMQLVNDGDEESARDSLTWVKLGSALVGADSEVANTPHKVVLSIIGKGESENEDLDAGGLVLKSWRMSALPEDFDPDDENFVKPLLLMPGVVGLNFRVFNPKDNLEEGKLPGVPDEESSFELDDEEKWIDDDWTGDYTNRLPYAVETTLYLEPPDDRSDPIKVQRVTTLPTAFLSWPEKFGKSSSNKNADGSNRNQNSGGGNGNRNTDGGGRNRNTDGGSRK
jgi:prepilin-type N-terminal cleavage/methylation domain-containing protein